ncbi:MAG: hypothetical protein BWX93_01947 [Bacteroidetes bacterium ADurb.Bin139]|nr:MAG: hypothetical protein BWX93_01947 [Bacteroidetes bacterium ADurb.Bin139]
MCSVVFRPDDSCVGDEISSIDIVNNAIVVIVYAFYSIQLCLVNP